MGAETVGGTATGVPAAVNVVPDGAALAGVGLTGAIDVTGDPVLVTGAGAAGVVVDLTGLGFALAFGFAFTAEAL